MKKAIDKPSDDDRPVGRYRKVEVRIWGDEKFRTLSAIPACGQGLWLYLLTGPHTGPIPGLFRAGRAGMAEELGWDQEAFDEALAEVMAQGMVKVDLKARVMWIPNALRSNRPESPNVVRSWASEFALIPECDLKREAYDALREGVSAIGEKFLEAFDARIEKPSPKPSAKPSPKAMVNQDKHKHEEQESSVPGGTGAGAPPPQPKTAAELTKAELWTAGKSLLREQGMVEQQCGTFVGKLVRDYGDDTVIDVVRSAVVERPADVASWLVKACQTRGTPRRGAQLSADQQRNESLAKSARIKAALEAGGGALVPASTLAERVQ